LFIRVKYHSHILSSFFQYTNHQLKSCMLLNLNTSRNKLELPWHWARAYAMRSFRLNVIVCKYSNIQSLWIRDEPNRFTRFPN
jgi:hypothetical protein